MLPKVVMYIDLYPYLYSQNIIDYLKYFYYNAWNIYF